MDQPRTVRVTLMYRATLTEGVGGWSTTVTLAPGTTLTVRSVRVPHTHCISLPLHCLPATVRPWAGREGWVG